MTGQTYHIHHYPAISYKMALPHLPPSALMWQSDTLVLENYLAPHLFAGFLLYAKRYDSQFARGQNFFFYYWSTISRPLGCHPKT